MKHLDNISSDDLIAALKHRGFKVAKADRIRTASSSISVSVGALLSYGKEVGYMENIYNRLGTQLGVFLIESGAIPVIEEIEEGHNRRFRASVTVVVDDPKFDWPYPMSLD